MVKLLQPFSRLCSLNVLVVGDFVLDKYTRGKVGRISPEAPVPIIHVTHESFLPGMAGNVILNMMALGAKVRALGRIGNDSEGSLLKRLLEEKGADCSALFTEEGYKTPIKNRIIAENQQLMRIDDEQIMALSPSLEKEIRESVEELFAGIDIVSLSDYGKGFLTEPLLTHLISEARARSIPLLVDPKGDDFTKYFGASLIKPNHKEAYTASKLSSNASLDDVGKTLLKLTGAETIMITRSEKGLSLFLKDEERIDFPVQAKEVRDVTGAGDTVLAVITLALGNRLSIQEACHLANIAAALAVERIGCACITLAELGERLLYLDSSNKIFDEGHLFALKQILKGEEYRILGIEQSDSLTPELFKAIKKLHLSNQKLILYCSEFTDDDFLTLLSSLEEVDFIILRSESLFHLCQEIAPSELYVVKKGDLLKLDHAKMLLEHLAEKVLG